MLGAITSGATEGLVGQAIGKTISNHTNRNC